MLPFVHPFPEQARPRAFTLLELLTVIAIIAIVASLSVGVARRASEAGRTARARTELTLLAAALANYYQTYGDFPHTGEPADLLQALVGRRGPLGATIEGRSCLDLLRFSTSDARDPSLDPTTVLLDPWGRPYRYAYQTPQPWNNSRYVLYSVGSDGLAVGVLLSGGFVNLTPLENQDNLYADRL